ncbi:MAG: tRNA dimethylallyltransferase [Actinomycetota bacterium]|nr:tRNA dimethylallyltransferase [Actinomycetota bacterium]
MTAASAPTIPGERECPPKTQHLAVVGPTASGKSTLALAAAEVLGDVEIVSVDSMQVYRGMDIGTAKPTPAEQTAVPHHLIDLADPGEYFSVARFQAEAAAVIAGIESRGHRALLVGGTGLYFHSVVDGYALPPGDDVLRTELEAQAGQEGGLARLMEELQALDPVAAARILPDNARRIVRALEVIQQTGRPFSSFGPGVLQVHGHQLPVRTVGLWIPRPVGARRIEERIGAMIEAGFVDEVARLAGADAGGLSVTAREAIGYKEILTYLDGTWSLAYARRRIADRTRQLARRQRVWFRRDRRIAWIGCDGNSVATLHAVLATWNRPSVMGDV